VYADHHVEFLQFSDEMSELVLFRCECNIMSSSSSFANVVHLIQHYANLFDEFILNQNVDVIDKVKHFDLDFKRFAFLDETCVEE